MGKLLNIFHKSKPTIKHHDYGTIYPPVDIDRCAEILTKITSTNSCGVHVRRGDLAQYNLAYGYPTPKEYYIKAIKLLNFLVPDIEFFFFSEECDWIKNEIIPNIGNKIKYNICDKNGADKGYLDLFLMSKSGGFVIMDKYYQNITNNFPNVIILNDTILLNATHKD